MLPAARRAPYQRLARSVNLSHYIAATLGVIAAHHAAPQNSTAWRRSPRRALGAHALTYGPRRWSSLGETIRDAGFLS